MNINRLADVDIMVVDPNQRIELLVEVEERGCSPKKILCDVFAIMMCNRFAVRQSGVQHYFKISDRTRLVVSGVLPPQGNRIEKVNNVIVPRFRQLKGFEDGIDPHNIDFVFEPSIEHTVGALKRIVCERLPT